MTKKSIPTNYKPAATSEDVSTLSFEALQERFEKSGCDRDSFALASTMYAKDFHKAMKLLPLNFDVYTQDTSEVQKIDTRRLDFDGNDKTTGHEWSSALVAAKKLKLGAGITLDVEKVDQVVEEASKIYIQTRKDEAVCRPL